MGTPLYDGLVIVHPDWAFGVDGDIPPEYRNPLQREAERYRAHNRKIFVYPSTIALPEGSYPRPQYHPQIGEFLHDALTMPRYNWDGKLSEDENVSRAAQDDVDFIAYHIRKQHHDITVGLGGMLSDACVYAVAHSTCARVRTNYRGKLLWTVRAPRPLRYGRVIDNIVWHADDPE